ncbi:MAG: ribosomal protein L16, partial [Nanoarchaeota archaeon]
MAIRKASSYSKKNNQPFTRISKAKSKSYIKVVPPNKVVKYNIGNQKAFVEGKFPFILRLHSDEMLVIRDTAIEAGRMVLTKNLENRLLGKFYLWVKIFPHHLLRNN